MKLAVQSDFFIRQYGAEEGIRRMKNIGYRYAEYTVSDRYDAPFTTQWGDRELKESFAPIGNAFADSEIRPVYTLIGNELFNDLIPESFDARKKMAIHCARACAYMGCDTLAVKPVAFYRRASDYKERTKLLTLEAFDEIRWECDRLGLQMAIVNNTPNYATQIPYGCRAEEVMELSERYRAKVVVSPLNAAGAMVDFDEMIHAAGERLLAVRLEDADASAKKPSFPMMGFLDYTSLYELLSKAPDSAYGVMMVSAAYRRYLPFYEHGELFDALDELLFSMGTQLTAKKGEEAQ